MPSFNESTLVEAPCEEVWELLSDISTVAADIMGVKSAELHPTGRPLEIGSQLHVTTTALSKLIVANIVDVDEQAFTIQSRLTGSSGVSGEIATELHHVDDDRCRLAVSGDLRGSLLTKAVLSVGLVIFRQEGIQQIGQTLTAHAHARRGRSLR